MCHVPTLPQWALTPRPRLLRSETPSHRHIQREALMANTAYNTGRHELGTKSQPERGADTSQSGLGARSAASSLPAPIRSQTFVARKVLFRGSETRASNSGKASFFSIHGLKRKSSPGRRTCPNSSRNTKSTVILTRLSQGGWRSTATKRSWKR